jgi:hypothetical protein
MDISVEEIVGKLDGGLAHVTNQTRSVFNRLGGSSELQPRIEAKECLVSSTHS